MYKPKVYAKVNRFAQDAAKFLVKKHFGEVQWDPNKNYRILDVGCGEGTTLKNVIIPAIPSKRYSITGIDQSEEMVKQAIKLFRGEENIDFLPVKIEEAKEKFKLKFDLIISMNCFHFVEDQLACYKNLHEMLQPKEKIFVVRPVYPPNFKVYDDMAAQEESPDYLKENIRCRFYQDVKDNKEVIKKTKELLEEVGFSNIKVAVETLHSDAYLLEEFVLWHISVNPYWRKVPKAERKTYVKKLCGQIFNMDVVSYDYDNEEKINLTWSTDFMVITATK